MEIRESRKIRVLHLGSPVGLYGAERWILALVGHLPSEIVDSTVGAIRDDPDLGEIPLCQESAKFGLRTITFDSYGKISISAVRKIREFLLSHKIHILHTHGYKSDLIGLLAAQGTQCRTVATPHGWSTDAGFKLKVYEVLDRLGFFFVDAVVPLSRDLHVGLLKWPGLRSKLQLILNGVDVSEIDAAADDGATELFDIRSGFVVGYIGQLIPRKGLDTLIRAFHALDIYDKKLVLIGDGPQRSELETLVCRLGETDRVWFLGYREDRLKLLKQFTVFALPSLLEGIPRCLMEAMAARVPVIASDIPGCNDLVTSGETGVLFELHNEKALEAAMAELAASSDLRRTLADNGRELVLNYYSAEVMAQQYTELYLRMCAEDRKAPGDEADTVS